MATTREQIQGWLEAGRRQGDVTHVIVVCDTFSYEDYPVYVHAGQDPHAVAAAHDGTNMQSVMEVYALHLDLETQLAEHRAKHYDAPPSCTLHDDCRRHPEIGAACLKSEAKREP